MTGVNLLICELTSIISFPLTSTATHFALLVKVILKPTSISLMQLPPARNVEILNGQSSEPEEPKIWRHT